MPTLQELSTPYMPTWCPGCGNFTIWSAFKNACVKMGWDNSNSVMVAGIGCHGHLVNYTKLTAFEGLHGRALPVATGIKMANNRLNVFVFTGDGDSLAEGGNHFLHACRRNHDIKIFLHDNAIYGLTTGQTSPMTPLGFKSKSTPGGNLDDPISPLTIAISAGASFVARAFAGDIPKLTELFIKAVAHKGIALLDILQPCVTFNKNYSFEFYRENSYYLGPEHDVTNRTMAFQKSLEWGPKKIALGVFYQSDHPSYESHLPQIAQKPLIDKMPEGKNLEDLFKKYT